jgi:DnaD/phage-associated family protein
MMDRWIDEYRFEIELILKACESSSKTSNPNLNYISKILSDWYAKGIKRVEDISVLDKKQSKDTIPSAAKTNRHKTKFHLPESRGEQYSAEELESLVLNNQKKKFNR